MFDVAIIGGGVVGCLIARTLSRYQVKTALIEATHDVANGASKANSGIVHAGYDAKTGSHMARLNVQGNAMFDELCAELGVPLQRCGSLVIGFNEADDIRLRLLYEQGCENGVPNLQIIDGDTARQMEPTLSKDVTRALYAPTGAITCPYELTIAAFENARKNGVACYFDQPVIGLYDAPDGLRIKTKDMELTARFVINAAGVHADEIAQLVGDTHFTIQARKGEYLLLDKRAKCTQHVIFQTPNDMGKGVLVAPTVDGNVFAGPTALNLQDRQDVSVTSDSVALLQATARKSIPDINFRSVITAFAGLRAYASTDDFVLGASEKCPRLIHAAGICSPGLSCAPAIAAYIVACLGAGGLELAPNEAYIAEREPIKAFRHMTKDERIAILAENPLYGRVICRCETITEAEIVEAVHRGADSVDAIKRRTRAGMGRCQGGFCQSRVMEIIARELGKELSSVTKSGGASYIVEGPLFKGGCTDEKG